MTENYLSIYKKPATGKLKILQIKNGDRAARRPAVIYHYEHTRM